MRNQEGIAWVRLLVAWLALAKREVFFFFFFYLGRPALLGVGGRHHAGGPGGASKLVLARTWHPRQAVLLLSSLPKRVSSR